MLAKMLICSNEIKHPVARQHNIDDLGASLNNAPDAKQRVIELQPIKSANDSHQIVHRDLYGPQLGLSMQTHKYLNIP